MKKREIIFYAPFGKGIPLESIGGAEAGCLRTKALYEKAGIKVFQLHKPAISGGKLKYFWGLLLIPIKLCILLATHKGACLHVVGFYRKIIRYENLLINIGKIFGRKTIYELRNGSMVLSYKEGSDSYRKILKKLLLEPDVVLCQGEEYVKFIKENWGVERSYYPNYIMDDFISENNTNRPHPIRLIFFGRVIAQKRIDVIIEALFELRAAGFDAVLDIIGGSNESYKTTLDEQVAKLEISDYVTFHGRKTFDFIAEKLKVAHYFLFPSEEKQEGHSNSLTEAMGCGVVPIVSPAGFNASICGCPELVIPKMDAKLYATKIIEIEMNGKWKSYSTMVFDRVKTTYTSSIVGEKLISYIMPLFSF